MDLIELVTYIAVGIIQGATELVPVSSSGNLLLFSNFANIDLSLVTIAVLHLGTLGAIVAVLRKDLHLLTRPAVFKNVVITTIPAAIIGILFNDRIEDKFTVPAVILVSLILWGIVMIVIESVIRADKGKHIADLSTKDALLIGIAQMIALIPGTSRSGMTALAGVVSGLSKEDAFKYGFLAGMPVILGAGLFSLTKVASGQAASTEPLILIASGIAAFISGVIAATILLKNTKRKILTLSGAYRIVLGTIITLTFIL